MAIKELALITEKNNRKKKKEKEILKAPTTKKTISKPTVKSNDKGKSYVDKSTISKKPTVQKTTQKPVVTNKERLSSKDTFAGVKSTVKPVKSTKKRDKISTGVYDVYKRDGKYYYDNGRKEIEIDKKTIENAQKNKRTGIIGHYDKKGKFTEIDENGRYLTPKVIRKDKKENLSKQLNAMKNDIKSGNMNVSTAITDVANIAGAATDFGPAKNYKNALKTGVNAFDRFWTGSTKTLEHWLDLANDATTEITSRQNYLVNRAFGMSKKEAKKEMKEEKKANREWVSRDLVDEFKDKTGYNKIQPSLEEGSLVKKDNLAGKVIEGVGGMLPSLAVGQATNLGIASKSTEGLTGLAKAKTVAGNLGRGFLNQAGANTVLAGQSYGSGLEEAYKAGAREKDARLYGLGSAATELLTEWISGGIPGTKSQGALDDIIENLIDKKAKKISNKYVSKVVASVLKSNAKGIGEGLEEALADMINPSLKNLTYSNGEKVDWSQVKESALTGYLIGMFLNSPESIDDLKKGINDAKIETARKEQLLNEIDQMVEEAKVYTPEQREQANEIAERVESGQIKEDEGLALLDQVRNGTYSSNKNLETIANQEYQNLQNQLQQGQMTEDQYLGELNNLSNAVNQTKEEINIPQKEAKMKAMQERIQQMDVNGYLSNNYTDEQLQGFMERVYDDNLSAEELQDNLYNEIFKDSAKKQATNILETSAKDTNMTRDEFIKRHYTKNMDQEFDVTKEDVGKIYDKYHKEETEKDNYEELKKKAEKEVVKTTSQKSGKKGRMYQGNFYSDDNFNFLDDDDIKLTTKLMKKQGNQQKLTKKEEQQVEYLKRKREGLKNPELNPDIKGYSDIKADYKYTSEYKFTKADREKINNALDIVSANRQKRRTKQQWLDVANMIGSQSEKLDSESLKNLAFGSWTELAPNQKDVLNRQGAKYVPFSVDEWVKAVYKGAGVGTKIKQENLTETQPKQEKTQTNETKPKVETKKVTKEDIQYGDSDNPQIIVGRLASTAYNKSLESFNNQLKYLKEDALKAVEDYGGTEKLWKDAQTMSQVEIANNFGKNTEATNDSEIKQEEQKTNNEETKDNYRDYDKQIRELEDIQDDLEEYIKDNEDYHSDNEKVEAEYQKELNEKRSELERVNKTLSELKENRESQYLKDIQKLPNPTEKTEFEGFSSTDTDFPFANEILNAKGKEREDILKHENLRDAYVVEMTPKEYLENAGRYGWQSVLSYEDISKQMGERSQKNIDAMAEAIKNGEKLPMPYLEFGADSHNQEGRHRAFAAEKAGLKTIPVLVMEKNTSIIEDTAPKKSENIPAKTNENVISEEIKPQKQKTQQETTETQQQEETQGPEILVKTPKEKESIFKKLKEKYNSFRHHFTDHREAWYDLSRETKNPDLNSRADAIDLSDAMAQVDIGRAQTDLNHQRYTNFTNYEEIKNLNKQIEDIQKDNSITEKQKEKQIEKLNKQIEKNKNVDMSFEKAFDLYKDIPVKDKNAFLVHQLNIDRWYQGKDQFQIPLQESQKKVEEYREKYGEDIDNWSENVYQFYRNQAQKEVDAGRITQELANQWLKETPHYVHIQRYIGKKGSNGISTKNGRVDSDNLIQRVKGSSLPILPIKQTSADYTRQVMGALQLNKLGIEYLQTVGTGSQDSSFEQITDPDEIFGVNSKILEDDGKGNYTFVVYNKGVPIEVPISKDMYEGLKPRDIRNLPTSKIVKFQREIITNKNPVFGLARNPAKDFQAMLLYSKHSAKKSISTYNKLFVERTALKDTTLFNDGVTAREMVDLYYDAGNQANSYYNNGEFESEKGKIKKGVDKAFSPIEKGNNFMESMPRITEFANTLQSEGYTVYNGKVVSIKEACDARINDNKEKLENGEITKEEYNKSLKKLQKAKKKAKTPTATAEQAVMRASHDAAEITVNFKRGGTWGKNIDRNFAVYSSPAIQGAAKFGRTVTEAVGDAKAGDWKAARRLVTRAAALGVAPALLSAAMYGDDDDYKELQDYQKDQYYLIKGPNGKWIRIPKGREISTMQSFTRRSMNKANGEDFGIKDYGTFALNQVGPTNPLENNFLSPVVSAFLTNRSWSGNPIVSDYMKDNVAEEDQYNEKTDEISKWLGKQTKISPMKINYVLDQYSGGLGDIVLPYITPKATNDAKGPLSAIIKNEFTFDQANSSKNVNEFYNSKNRLTKKLNKKTATEKDKVGKAYLGTISQELYPLTEKKRNIQMDKNLSKKEKYEKALEVQKQMNKLTKKAVKDLDDVSIGENTATIGGKLFYRNKDARNGTGWSQESDKTTKRREKLGLTPEKYYYYKIDEAYTKPDGKKLYITSGKYAKSNIAMVDAFNFDTSDYLEYKYKVGKIKGKNRYDSQSKVIKYLNTLPISAAQKAYLYKTRYKSYRDYNGVILNKLKQTNLSKKEKEKVYSYLKLGR